MTKSAIQLQYANCTQTLRLSKCLTSRCTVVDLVLAIHLFVPKSSTKRWYQGYKLKICSFREYGMIPLERTGVLMCLSRSKSVYIYLASLQCAETSEETVKLTKAVSASDMFGHALLLHVLL